MAQNRGRARHRHRASFPADATFHLLEIGIQAIQLSPYHAGPPEHRPQRLDPAIPANSAIAESVSPRPRIRANAAAADGSSAGRVAGSRTGDFRVARLEPYRFRMYVCAPCRRHRAYALDMAPFAKAANGYLMAPAYPHSSFEARGPPLRAPITCSCGLPPFSVCAPPDERISL
jgi:hypothetical protein